VSKTLPRQPLGAGERVGMVVIVATLFFTFAAANNLSVGGATRARHLAIRWKNNIPSALEKRRQKFTTACAPSKWFTLAQLALAPSEMAFIVMLGTGERTPR
jgi:hypothetical protein